MENSKKNGYLCNCLLPWQQSAIYLYERKWNPRCVPNLHCECQELKPKVETNTSFLVRHPFSGVDTVKTVGSHLNCYYLFGCLFFYNCLFCCFFLIYEFLLHLCHLLSHTQSFSVLTACQRACLGISQNVRTHKF